MDKKTTLEWNESSDWDELAEKEGGYTLGIGYCYVGHIAELFKEYNIQYHQFQTKWGRCGVTYLFSALRPDNIIVLNAWANNAAICNDTAILFRIWKSIFDDLAKMNVPILFVDLPGAWNLCVKNDQKISLDLVKERRSLYKKEVINPIIEKYSTKKIEYIDIQDVVDPNWEMIDENLKGETSKSPWHVSTPVYKVIFNSFLKFKDGRYSKDFLIKELRSLRRQKEVMNKIEIGGGKNVRDGWKNLDKTCTNYDILKTHLSEIPDNSVHRYFSSHCFEHLPLKSLPFIFKNVFRSLVHNGYFRICVPSVEKVVKLHMKGEIIPYPVKIGEKICISYNCETPIFKTYEEAHDSVLKIIGGWNPSDFFNGEPEKEFNQFGHINFIDRYILYHMLWNVGFKKIKFCEAGESEIEDIKNGLFDHSGEYTDFVEAQKVEKYEGAVKHYD